MEQSEKQVSVSKIAEILVLNGGYGITCEFCTYKQCSSQVSGLTCSRGVESFLLSVLSEDSTELNQKEETI